MPEQLPETRFLDMAAKAVGPCVYTGWAHVEEVATNTTRASIIAHARTLAELAALKPVPEVDEDAEAVCRILNAYHNVNWKVPDRQGSEYWDAALAAFKSERPRYTPEQATEIAREICARVAEEIATDSPEYVVDYRNGTFDSDPDVTFAKAMLLHETGEGK